MLLDAAFDSLARDLRANWRTGAGLAVGAVALTVVVVAVVARLLVPGMPWARWRSGRSYSVEREVRLARVDSLRAALAATPEKLADELSGLLRSRYEVLLRRAEANAAGAVAEPGGADGPDAPSLDVGSELVPYSFCLIRPG